MTTNAKMTVRCTSGREECFEIELYGSGKSAGFRLKDFVNDPTVLLQTADELILIPAAAIECITFSCRPTPSNARWTTFARRAAARRQRRAMAPIELRQHRNSYLVEIDRA